MVGGVDDRSGRGLGEGVREVGNRVGGAFAAGPAPGQGGDFSDRFAVDEVTAEGTLVRMVLDPEPGAFVLSDLSSGPVLFATC